MNNHTERKDMEAKLIKKGDQNKPSKTDQDKKRERNNEESKEEAKESSQAEEPVQ